MFDCYMFKTSLGSLGAFLSFGELISRKAVVVEQNGPKYGPIRGKFLVHAEYF